MVLAPERALTPRARRRTRSRRPPPYDAVHAAEASLDPPFRAPLRGLPGHRPARPMRTHHGPTPRRRTGRCPRTSPRCHRPTPRCTTSPIALVCKKTRNRLGACLYKHLTIPRARGRHTAEPPLPPLVFTVNPTLRSLASPTRLAPTAPRVPNSFSACLLVCPSGQPAGVISPAAAAGQPPTSSTFRSSPKPTDRLSAIPRP
jgi:hypothetical protein